MEFTFVDEVDQFRDSAAGLIADEARHNLMRGVLAHLASDPEAYEEYRLVLVLSRDIAQACALVTLPYRVIVADISDEQALRCLVDGLRLSGVPIPGVVANRPTVDRFVDAWCVATGDEAELSMAQGVFSISEVAPLSRAAGRPIVARPEHVEMLLGWVHAFLEEAIPDEPREDERLRKMVQRQVDPETPGRYWLWEVDGALVSMSSNTGPTGKGARINGVYTPPEMRGKGYSTSLVAAQTTWLLTNEVELCFLYTDLANPTSNSIYERIGYRMVAESASYNFVNQAT